MSAPTVLRCPSCASPIKAGDLNPVGSFAKCSHCGTLLALAGTPLAPPADWRPRPDLGLPAGLHVEKTSDGLEIRRRWFSPAILFAVFFCIAWDGFLVFWYSVAFGFSTPWIMKVFPLIHVAVGVSITYATVAGLFNTTRLQLNRKELRIDHGPVPWAGNRTVDRESIEQLFCRQITSRNNDTTTHRYEVWMKSRGTPNTKLVGGGLTADQALALEQQVERALGIPDRPMPGELER